MVAFKNSIIFFLVIPTGATTGQRILIDGINGVIDIFNNSNHLIAQLGAGVPLTIFEGNVTYTVKDNVNGDGFPGMQWDTPGGDAFLNIVQGGVGPPSVGINAGSYVNAFGHGARRSLFLTSNDVIGGASLGTTIGGTTREGGTVFVQDLLTKLSFMLNNVETSSVVVEQNTILLNSGVSAPTTADAYIQINGNSGHTMYFNLDNTTSPARYIALQEGLGNSQPVLLVPNENWHSLALTAWVGSGVAGYFNGLQYRKDATGIVWMNGSITAPAVGVTNTICTLPAGFRPSNNVIAIFVYTVNAPKIADFVLNAATGNFSMSSELGAVVSGTTFISMSWPAEF